MNIQIIEDCTEIDWAMVKKILKSVGMAYHAPETLKAAFESSHAKVFVLDGDKLIGFGRAISDGAYQSAIYDCAVIPSYQGRGIGRRIVQHLLAALPRGNVILYASPGKEGFYEKLGFRKMKTAMARFQNPDTAASRGFTY